jgi:hypothetical protein
MHVAKSVLLLVSGAMVGIIFMISCGDNWHLAVWTACGESAAHRCCTGCEHHGGPDAREVRRLDANVMIVMRRATPRTH